MDTCIRSYNKNRWRGDPLWRSYELFCVRIFHESEGRVKYHYTKQWTWSPKGSPTHLFLFLCCTIDVGLVKYHYTKQWTWSPQGSPTHLFLFLCRTIDVISSSGIVLVLRDLHWRSRCGDRVQNRPYYGIKVEHISDWKWLRCSNVKWVKLPTTTVTIVFYLLAPRPRLCESGRD